MDRPAPNPSSRSDASFAERVKRLTQRLGIVSPSDLSGQASCLEERGDLWHSVSDFGMAAPDVRAAAVLREQSGDWRRAAEDRLRESQCWAEVDRSDDARAAAEKAIELSRGHPEADVHERALLRLGAVHRRQGRLEEAETCNREALERLRRGGNRTEAANAMHSLALVLWEQARFEEAEALENEALEIHRALGNEQGGALCLTNLAALAFDQGRYPRSLKHAREALEIARKHGLRRVEPIALTAIGSSLTDVADFVEAEKAHAEALAIYRRQGAKRSCSIASYNLGSELLPYTGRATEGRAHLEESLRYARAAGSPVHESMALVGLVELAVEGGGDTKGAHAMAEEALRLAHQSKQNELIGRAEAMLMATSEGASGAPHAAAALEAAARCGNPFWTVRAAVRVLDWLDRQKSPVAGAPDRADVARRLATAERELLSRMGSHAVRFREHHPFARRIAARIVGT